MYDSYGREILFNITDDGVSYYSTDGLFSTGMPERNDDAALAIFESYPPAYIGIKITSAEFLSFITDEETVNVLLAREANPMVNYVYQRFLQGNIFTKSPLIPQMFAVLIGAEILTEERATEITEQLARYKELPQLTEEQSIENTE